jgi:hypothetical protein
MVEYYGAPPDEVLRTKPTASRSRCLKKVTVSMTTNPGIPLDPSVPRNFAEPSAAVRSGAGPARATPPAIWQYLRAEVLGDQRRCRRVR